jgi:NAD(P)-dependent dehydrogenase (short-subunit alcohol dehydrogenase family)
MTLVALVTGTSSGVGLACSVQLAHQGYHVIATMRDVTRSAALEQAADLAGVNVDIRSLDTTDEAGAGACIDEVAAEFGAIDVLVNNAGAGFVGTLELIPFQHLRNAMEVDFFGTARITQLVLPLQRRAGRGRIITVTSTAGVVGTPFNDAYSSAKFATEGLMQALAPVAARYGIYVSVVEPGPIESRFLENASRPPAPNDSGEAYADVLAAYRRYISATFGQSQSAEDVARVIVDAATCDRPRFRYQTSAEARRTVERSLADVDGSAVLAETKSWLES